MSNFPTYLESNTSVIFFKYLLFTKAIFWFQAHAYQMEEKTILRCNIHVIWIYYIIKHTDLR